MGEIYKVETMIQKGQADINLADSRGFTPLHLALGAKQQYVFIGYNFVYSPSFRINLQSLTIETYSDISELLIKSGANVNSVTLKYVSFLSLSHI